MITYSAFAKLNLSLYVGPPNLEGFHYIKSLFQSISLCDKLHIKPSIEPKHKITFNNAVVPKENTCQSVIDVLGPRLNNFWDIKIDKQIPMGAGLGGGSTDAACLLLALSELESLNLSLEESVSIASSIGSDVPFFVYGGTAIVSGLGDIVHPRESLHGAGLLFCSNIHCNTKQVYGSFDQLAQFDHLDDIDSTKLFKFGHNSLYDAAINKYPELKLIYERLSSKINAPIYFSGSGSTFYCLCSPLEQKQFQLAFEEECIDVIPFQFLTSGTEGRT